MCQVVTLSSVEAERPPRTLSPLVLEEHQRCGAGWAGDTDTGAHGGEEQEFETGKETRPENAADSSQRDDPGSFDMDMFSRKDTALEKLFISVRR